MRSYAPTLASSRSNTESSWEAGQRRCCVSLTKYIRVKNIQDSTKPPPGALMTQPSIYLVGSIVGLTRCAVFPNTDA
ncbi:hypothetical protein EG68_02887 [Paragonimus skrjabini miyazakii]|uniref:Uncharacterized protein n=1 Tax=Paragonimus skrjabini miyazakii TaxID=59628 RepID=A0A8S9Z8K4_9TREM|nr:hypothetical protein EG68_02887 [Paragonimus skrjabini miyazakii]